MRFEQADKGQDFVKIFTLGLYGSNGYGFAAVAGKRKESGGFTTAHTLLLL
ncbi:MAG: hypothetical protein QG578_394 [Thermodesulfobacteriota bacterium]|nr:hypothetical protein [Thermodesulfobacteriota bacterium]